MVRRVDQGPAQEDPMMRTLSMFAFAAVLGLSGCEDRPGVDDENDRPDRIGVSDEPDSLDRGVDIDVDVDDEDELRVKRTRSGEATDGDGRTFPDRDADGRTGTEEI